LRSPQVRALGLDLGDGHVQVSMNLLDPASVTPADVYDAVAAETAVERAELVGLIPAPVLERIPVERWPALDLDPSRTIEARVAVTRTRRSPGGGPGPAGGGGGDAPAR